MTDDDKAREAVRILKERGEEVESLRWLLANGLTVHNPDIFRKKKESA